MSLFTEMLVSTMSCYVVTEGEDTWYNYDKWCPTGSDVAKVTYLNDLTRMHNYLYR